MKEFTYFILGMLVSIPIAVLAPFMTSRLQERFSHRSKKQRQLLRRSPQRDYAEAKSFYEDPTKLVIFITSRVLLLTVLWIGQSIIDVVFGFAANASYLASLEVSSVNFDFNQAASWINVSASLIDVIILTYIFRFGLRAYRTVRRLRNFDVYEKNIQEQLASLDIT